MKRLLVLLILVAGAYVLRRRYSIEVEYLRPFPLTTGNGRYPHTGIRDPYLDSLRERR